MFLIKTQHSFSPSFYLLFVTVLFLVCLSLPLVTPTFDANIVAEKALCQATFAQQLNDALTTSPKAKITVNPFFVNSTTPCRLQCVLRTNGKNSQTMNPIQAPDFTICQGGSGGQRPGQKYSKTKLYCFQGQCLTIAQIAPLIAANNPSSTTPTSQSTATQLTTPQTTPTPQQPNNNNNNNNNNNGFWRLVSMTKDWVHIKDEQGNDRIILTKDIIQKPVKADQVSSPSFEDLFAG